MTFKPLTIASRQSPLAVAQAELVRDLLAEALGIDAADKDAAFPLRTYVTTGDRKMDPSLADIGGKGLFTKEIEAALLLGEADIAVHSMKDMPAEMPPGLVLAAVPAREDPRDALVSETGLALDDLAPGARVGTSSIRRRAQLARLRPDLEIVPMRGNVGTRLGKLAAGEADATFLAEAGLRRLGRDDVTRSPMDMARMLPAPGQGILCIQARDGHSEALDICQRINNPEAALASSAERAVVEALDASCRTPVAAHATLEKDELVVRAEILTPDGSAHYTGERRLPTADISMRTLLDDAAHHGGELASSLATEAGPDLARIVPVS